MPLTLESGFNAVNQINALSLIIRMNGVMNYGMPRSYGTEPVTLTLALTNATLPYVLQMANKRYKQALEESPALMKGLNIIGGKITHKKVAEAFGLEYHPAESIVD